LGHCRDQSRCAIVTCLVGPLSQPTALCDGHLPRRPLSRPTALCDGHLPRSAIAFVLWRAAFTVSGRSLRALAFGSQRVRPGGQGGIDGRLGWVGEGELWRGSIKGASATIEAANTACLLTVRLSRRRREPPLSPWSRGEPLLPPLLYGESPLPCRRHRPPDRAR